MRYALALLVLVAASNWSQAYAVENARALASYCQKLEQGTKGAARDIRIPNTKEALLCWGYMQAVQDLSVLVYEDGARIMGSCPPKQTTVLQLHRGAWRLAFRERTRTVRRGRPTCRPR